MGRWARVTVTDPPQVTGLGMHGLPRKHYAAGALDQTSITSLRANPALSVAERGGNLGPSVGMDTLRCQCVKGSGGSAREDFGWLACSSNNHQSSIILHQFPRDYSVWGQVGAWDPDHPNPYLFTGRRFDKETGLYYYRARYYHPEIGRFLQTDPIGYGDGMNWYAYCRNSPANFVDPRGLTWEDPAVRIVFYNGSDPTTGDQITDAASDPFWDIRIDIGAVAASEAGYRFPVDYMIDQFDELKDIIYEAIPVDENGDKIYDIDSQITIEGVWFIDHSGGFGGESAPRNSKRWKTAFSRLTTALSANNGYGAGATIHMRTCGGTPDQALANIKAIAEYTGHSVTGGNEDIYFSKWWALPYHSLWDPDYFCPTGYSIVKPVFNDSGAITGSTPPSAYLGYPTSVYRTVQWFDPVRGPRTMTLLVPVHQNAQHVY